MATRFVYNAASSALSQTTESECLRVDLKNLRYKQISQVILRNFKKCCSKALGYNKLPGMRLVWEAVRNEILINTLVTGKQKIKTQWKGIWQYLPRFQMYCPHVVAVPLPEVYPTNRPTHVSSGTHTRLFMVVLLIIAKYWRQPMHPAVESWPCPSTQWHTACPKDRGDH